MRPPVFHELGLEPARELALAERKLLIVDARGEWCWPCIEMNLTTWLDPGVIAWMRERAIAIQIDVDAQRELAQRLRVEVLPTTIVFVDGSEFHRVLGEREPKELLAWLDGVTRGERSVRHSDDLHARMTFARELTRVGRYAEALVQYLWLWEHMLELAPAMYGVRYSFLTDDLKDLVNADASARLAIGKLRDRYAPGRSGSTSVESRRDWQALNEVLEESDRTLAWYDAHEPADAAHGSTLEHDIAPVLIAAGRWADAGALYKHPLETINRVADQLAHERSHRPELAGQILEFFRATAARLVRALCTAGRDADADLVERRARDFDPSDEMASALAKARIESG